MSTVANLTKKFVHSLQSQLVEYLFVTQRIVSLDCLTKHDKGRKPTFRLTSNWPSCLFGERENTGQNTHALAKLEGHTRGTFVCACTFSDRLSQAERKDYSKSTRNCLIQRRSHHHLLCGEPEVVRSNLSIFVSAR